MSTVPVTNEDFTVEATVARLKKLLEAPPLTLSVKGGGLPDPDGQHIVLDHALLIERAEVEHVVWQFERIMRLSREEPHMVPADQPPAG